MKKKTDTPKKEKPVIFKELRFVTFGVPGFEDGTPLEYRLPFDPMRGRHEMQALLVATRKTPEGLTLLVEIPLVPESINANVRVRRVESKKKSGIIMAGDQVGIDCARPEPYHAAPGLLRRD